MLTRRRGAALGQFVGRTGSAANAPRTPRHLQRGRRVRVHGLRLRYFGRSRRGYGTSDRVGAESAGAVVKEALADVMIIGGLWILLLAASHKIVGRRERGRGR